MLDEWQDVVLTSGDDMEIGDSPAPLASVAVVIPTRNRSALVLRALASVQAQTFRGWVAYVVDDASTDDTADRVAEVGSADPRIRLIRMNHHGGAQAARNRGIAAAATEWVAFLDADDEWLPDSLEVRLAAALTDSRDVVHSECYARRAGKFAAFNVPPMAGDIYRQLLQDPGPTFPGMLVRRSAISLIGGLDEDLVAYQEWDTAIRLARESDFSFVASPTFIYNLTSEASISRNRWKAARGYEQVVRKHRVQMSRELGRTGLALHYRRLTYLYLHAHRRPATLRCVLLAFFYSPLEVRGAVNLIRGFVRGGVRHGD